MKHLGCLVLFGLACAQPPASDPMLQSLESWPEVQQCMQREEVEQYLARVKQLILDQWEFPPSVTPDQTVDILFSIAESGELGAAVVPDAYTQEIEDSALEAIQAAAPFPPVPKRAACLTVFPLRATFANPKLR